MKSVFVLPLAMLSLTGCGQIWNAGDLAQWVRKQAIEAGCAPESIELAEWYVNRDGKNLWPVSCRSARDDTSMTLEIGVDEVWTPSQ